MSNVIFVVTSSPEVTLTEVRNSLIGQLLDLVEKIWRPLMLNSVGATKLQAMTQSVSNKWQGFPFLFFPWISIHS